MGRMAGSLERTGSYLAYLYLLRVPILVWIGMVLLPFVAVPEGAPAEALLRGTFDIAQSGHPGWTILSFALVTLASLMTAVTVGITARLILLDGGERFGVGAVRNTPGVRLSLRILPLSAAIPIVVGAYWQTRAYVHWGIQVAGIVVGLLAFVFLMQSVHAALWDLVFTGESALLAPRSASGARHFRLPLPRWLHRAASLPLRVATAVVQLSPAGYFAPKTEVMRGRHVFAVFHAVLAILLYIAVGLFKRRGFGVEPIVPTLCLALILLMVVCLGLTSLTFFFDRFRIPVLALLLVYANLVSFFPQGDNFFRAWPIAEGTTRSDVGPADVLRARAGKPVVLVAAAGGGIQASAWAAHVLSGLKQDLADRGDEFDRSLRLISGVSGGTVGAMYFLDAYQDGRLPDVGPDLREYGPVKASRTSSLDDVAWGLVYPDLVWSLAPFARGVWFSPPAVLHGANLSIDRGSILEDTWKRTPGLRSATLADWRRDVANQARPAAIFNATIVETGERLLLSTTDLESGCTPKALLWVGRREFVCEYKNTDLHVTTAARLSATFPYVSPATRIMNGGVFARHYHVVDGGYYDNYGVATLVEWLDTAVRRGAPRPSKVLIVQIRGFASGAPDRPDGDRGWVFQALHPATTLLGVRRTGQRSHNEVDLALILEGRNYPLPVTTAEFEFAATRPDGEPVTSPLSWRLTPAEKAALDDFWSSSPAIRAARTTVREFLAP
jgi:hypothetical protein